jgi:hypothetical protein
MQVKELTSMLKENIFISEKEITEPTFFQMVQSIY